MITCKRCGTAWNPERGMRRFHDGRHLYPSDCIFGLKVLSREAEQLLSLPHLNFGKELRAFLRDFSEFLENPAPSPYKAKNLARRRELARRAKELCSKDARRMTPYASVPSGSSHHGDAAEVMRGMV